MKTTSLFILSLALLISPSFVSPCSAEDNGAAQAHATTHAHLRHQPSATASTTRAERYLAVDTDNSFDGSKEEEVGDNFSQDQQDQQKEKQRDPDRKRQNPKPKTIYNTYNTVTGPQSFQTTDDVTVLFASFTTSSPAEYGFALIFTMILAVAFEALMACRRDDWMGLLLITSSSSSSSTTRTPLCTASLQTFLYTLTVFVGLLLILIIASTYNVGILIAALLGGSIAHLIFLNQRLKYEAKMNNRNSNTVNENRKAEDSSTTGSSGEDSNENAIINRDEESLGSDLEVGRAHHHLVASAVALTPIPENGNTGSVGSFSDLSMGSFDIAAQQKHRQAFFVASKPSATSTNNRRSRQVSHRSRSATRRRPAAKSHGVPRSIKISREEEMMRQRLARSQTIKRHREDLIEAGLMPLRGDAEDISKNNMSKEEVGEESNHNKAAAATGLSQLFDHAAGQHQDNAHRDIRHDLDYCAGSINSASTMSEC